MRVYLSTLVELVGFLLVLVAAFATDWRLGVVLAGVGCVVAGWMLGDNEVDVEGGEP